LISGASSAYDFQKSGVVKDFIEWFRPSRRDVVADAIEDGLKPSSQTGIPLDLPVPLVHLLGLMLSKPRQELVKFLWRESADLTDKLFDGGCHMPFIMASFSWWSNLGT
jgi:hypothetical protein